VLTVHEANTTERCALAYIFDVKEIATGRLGQAAMKYADHAPMATACCNACRTCVTTNVIGVATAALAATGVAMGRFFRASRGASRPPLVR
jgi:hypothetical protein